MGAHKLEVLKGDRNSIVDETGILDSHANDNLAVVAGRVMTHTAGGLLTPGLATAKLPFYAWSGLDLNNSPDVDRTRGMPYAGAARFGVIASKAAVELSTTEFDSADSYVIGAPLTALSTAATALADAGKLCNVNASTDVVVGYVSPRGKYTGPDGYATLAFYPAYVAGSTVPVAP
jgi:hypothetical protein